MSDEALIQRVRKEHERLDAIKASLEEAVQVPGAVEPGVWLQNLSKHFEHFRAHLIHRFALEEIGGFLNVVVERRPTLAAQVDDLRDGHQHLIELVGSTMESLRNAPADSESVESCALLVRMTLSKIKYHEEAEQLLVSHVFTQEIGVGD